MNRFVILFALILLAWVVCLVGCADIGTGDGLPDGWVTEPYPTDPYHAEPDTGVINGEREIVNIVDKTKDGSFMISPAHEPFFEDDNYWYYFTNIISHHIIVEFSDGTTMNVKEAFELGVITIEDLDRFGIWYAKDEKAVYVVRIIDRTVTEGIPTDDALEKFWEDESNKYYFPSIRSEYVLVECNNGDNYYVTEALVFGLITITDLDRFEISYYIAPKGEYCNPNIKEIYDRVARGEIENDNGEGMGDDTFDVFYVDDHYKYVLTSTPLESAVVVVYTDGMMEPVEDALCAGRITLADLDAYGITYGKYARKRILSIYEKSYSSKKIPYSQRFYWDVNYVYYVPNYDTEIRVTYADGSHKNAGEELFNHEITIRDLDKYGIQYFRISWDDFGKSPLVKIVDLTKIAEFEYSPAGQVFFEDDEYEYYFINQIKDIVLAVYEDGSTEPVWKALDAGRATIADLDKFGIEYLKEPKTHLTANEIEYEMLGEMVFIWNSEYTPQDLFDYSTQESQSLYGDMSVFTDYDSYTAFVSEINEKLTFDDSIKHVVATPVTLEELTAPYTAEWFNENALIFIHYSQGQYNSGNVITSVTIEDGNVLTVSLDTMNFGAYVGVDWFICVGVSKADIQNCTEHRLYVTQNNTAIGGKYS